MRRESGGSVMLGAGVITFAMLGFWQWHVQRGARHERHDCRPVYIDAEQPRDVTHTVPTHRPFVRM